MIEIQPSGGWVLLLWDEKQPIAELGEFDRWLDADAERVVRLARGSGPITIEDPRSAARWRPYLQNTSPRGDIP